MSGIVHKPVVGLPRGLLYYYYGAAWVKFFESLGAQVIVSGPTTKETLDLGGVIDEVCLPLKVYFGHVFHLCRRVEYLFVPRIISVSPGQYTCPKLIGLPDLLRGNVPDLPELLSVDVSLKQGKGHLYQAVVNIGRRLGKSPWSCLQAWYRACSGKNRWEFYRNSSSPGMRLRIGLIGHSYLIHDPLISMGIIDKLTQLETDVITPAMISRRQANHAAGSLHKRIFWSYCHQLAGAALAMIEQPAVDGLIFMTSFSCGPDSLIGEIIKQRASAADVPFMLLSVDEHTADAGIVTRLEAFTDMLQRRKRD
ncbi:MAG TPA: acyl-CoA dehydratase activase-related protein [Methylomusa anaerophila]|uniref:DUF2229 domain-containing protein n=1 Tax=Methylomusa anaerophila TaxID=1930071 RepID=A0A348ANN8_9FIRM|nr:acyl-CoA dehydratase activase-related protein [Methylomusa anaerophila]BBB92686.1 hypothetical protein MAMMFC1_03381 [Methylomusa anaerophila]HML87461.1 acyl-CoA dehydratase activase-related protein [Methylomusa anaerophila]